MLTSNLNFKHGLFNGATGHVIDIIYQNGHTPSDDFPDAVMVEFPCYTGPAFIPDNPKVVPIVPITR